MGIRPQSKLSRGVDCAMALLLILACLGAALAVGYHLGKARALDPPVIQGED